MASMTEIFGDVIHSYTRAQALEDGVLVDAGAMAKEAGIRYPVALTQAVYAGYVKVPKNVVCQDESGRLWDILWMLRNAAARAEGSVILFRVHVRNNNRRGMPPAVQFKAVCGPDDDGSPCITVMLPEED